MFLLKWPFRLDSPKHYSEITVLGGVSRYILAFWLPYMGVRGRTRRQSFSVLCGVKRDAAVLFRDSASYGL